MSLRDLVEGDCGGPGPLTSFTSHLVQDRGFRDDGIGQSHVVPFENTDENKLVDEYLDNHVNVQPQTFRMDNILDEIHDIDNVIHQQLPQVENNCEEQDTEWACQFLENRSEFYKHNSDSIWAENVHQPEASITTTTTTTTTGASTSHQDANEFGLGMRWAEDYFEHSLENDNADNNIVMKKKTFGSKWAQEFSNQQNPDLSNISDVDKNIIGNVSDINEIGKSWPAEFTGASSINEDTVKVESGEEIEDINSSIMENAWKNINENSPWLTDFSNKFDDYKDYKFNDDNEMITLKTNEDPMKIGIERLEAGDLPSAVLCFEAVVRNDVDNSEAWYLLGKTQAENEQDPLAIAALKKCLKIDDKNLSALMTLAVSYTNESYNNQACYALKEWLIKNDKYNNILSFNKKNNEGDENFLSSKFKDIHEEVKNLFIQAALINPTNEIDADVQCGLGVLFNLSNEYDKAIDCFQTALQVRPNDSRLWNRLGATMANGQKSAEAVDAYSKALELSPGFIRARYNLGISCINLSAYKEAGEHLLIALNQQAAGVDSKGQIGSPSLMSETIWSTMKLVTCFLNKYHLYDAIEKRDLKALNFEFEIS
ncbi:peroxisomal targeting signal 1 receptor isoform X2 [Aphidius gifuensis]|uniref:peroxisomal targeting signal 1 receptor isoform X2 n=1 Tax=Aphidius gifuensis TaxID=684658 RepID=UPI001CDC3121|nr:peroxisomal targeting signal 1 receptor isoform X2 [Aphidius gifuensis]XP_044014537.1 peroxisomal targeting signal 1 receptor isoform X2 [Aphidius gifuensis]